MDETVLKVVGQRVRDLRKKSGMSQEELGEKAGLHFSYIGGVERGEKNITLLTIQKISDALNVSVNELFVYTKNSQTKQSEKALLLDSLYDKLTLMDKSKLKKLQVLINELFED